MQDPYKPSYTSQNNMTTYAIVDILDFMEH